MGLTAGVLVACNAILGVTDVTLKEGDGGKRSRDGGSEEDPDTGFVEEVDANVPKEDRAELALGFLHGCGRLVTGQVKCWGDNFDGTLGDGLALDAGGRLSESSTPVMVPGITDAVSIASGSGHTCVVHKTGKVSCWGNNSNGQLGTSDKSSTSKPTPVAGIDDAIQVVAGTNFTCVLHKAKTASCWGENKAGGLGDNTTTERPTPAPVQQLSDVESLAAGKDYACAVLTSHDVMCWGANADGQLGIGSTTNAPLPTKLNALNDIVQVAGASRFSCARQSSGRVFCWGNNSEGQLGNGSPNTAPNPSPILVPSLGDAIWIWTGYEHACAIKKNGNVVCWGSNAFAQLGLGDAGPASVATPTPVPGTKQSYAVYTGGDRACALSTTGEGLCWGANAFGQLGVGNTNRGYTPTAMVNWP